VRECVEAGRAEADGSAKKRARGEVQDESGTESFGATGQSGRIKVCLAGRFGVSKRRGTVGREARGAVVGICAGAGRRGQTRLENRKRDDAEEDISTKPAAAEQGTRVPEPDEDKERRGGVEPAAGQGTEAREREPGVPRLSWSRLVEAKDKSDSEICRARSQGNRARSQGNIVESEKLQGEKPGQFCRERKIWS
jgi:hypothetical protein